MTTIPPKIYFVAGGTRGIGLALVTGIASRDPTTVIYAGGRNLSIAQKLADVVAQYPDRILPVTYVAGDKEGNEALAKEIQEKYGSVDTLIANAAIGNMMSLIHETPVQSFEEHFTPAHSPVSSIAHSPFNNSPYGMSKAALNWVVRKIHYENEWLGAVEIDMMKDGIAKNKTGRFKEIIKNFTLRQPYEAASILLDIMESSTRENDGGQFHNIDFGRHAW